MKKLRKITNGILIFFLFLVVIVVINTYRKSSNQIQVPPIKVKKVDENTVAKHLREAVRLKTISSRDDASLNEDEFKALHTLLEKQFPLVHEKLKRERINGLSLLFTWAGKNPKAKPILLMAHQDVVPIAPGTEKEWKEPPFSGAIKDGAIWGRGSWDNKGNLLAQLEAVEALLKEGFEPPCTVYLAYGADEEVNGLRGAAAISKLLASRGVELAFVLDEGLLILDGVLAGLKKPAALIGIAEKGYISIKLTVNATPGHSSMPPKKGTSAIAMLSYALSQLEENQMPAKIRGVAKEMFDALTPEMSGFTRIALSNLWLFGSIVQSQLESKGSTNSTLRTTTALTIVNAGNKENVLPGRAEAVINFRILPGDTKEKVFEHVRSVVSRAIPEGTFSLTILPGAVEVSNVAPINSLQYTALQRTVREVFPDAIVAPGLMVAATDSIHYQNISKFIYKFSPFRVQGGDLNLFHGTNERLKIKTYVDAIRFYERLLTQMTKEAL
ncbi:MAG: Succinyl-diaminopimelate desuccinylase [Turneriella sp.]|nr:Succinyl-diaminopimelate desuccinylase [Turneriella sp.]